MAIKRHINLMVMPEDNSRGFSLRISIPKLYIIAGLVSLVIAGLGFLVVNSAMDEIKLAQLEYLTYQNAEFKEKLASVNELEQTLKHVQDMEKNIRQLVGERIPEEEIRAKGVVEEEATTSAVIEQVTNEETPTEEVLAEFAAYVREHQGLAMLAPTLSPVEGGWISRGFGKVLDTEVMHQGIDFACPEGRPVVATADGLVVFAGWDDTYGNMVIIDHGVSGFSTIYGHNSTLEVSAGDYVSRGELIATTGNTGKSTGPHLHYEIRYNGVAVDPLKYIEK
jgi:murein DD-endopeptidase MepM/ murein hydrolase activator NlpD